MDTRTNQKIKNKTPIIYRFSILEIIKEKYLLMLVFLFFTAIAISFFFSNFSAVNQNISFAINLSAMFYFALSFWVIVSIPIIFSKELQNNFFQVIISKPISPYEYILGKYLSYMSVIFVYLLFAFIFSVLFQFHFVGSIYYYLGIFLEMAITVMAAIFFALNFKPINAIIYTFMFYVVSHSTYEIAKMAAMEQKSSLTIISKIFYYLFPSYDYYDFSGYLVYNEHNTVKLSFLILYTIFYVILLFTFCLTTFHKEK